jgi:hypothetical protein
MLEAKRMVSSVADVSWESEITIFDFVIALTLRRGIRADGRLHEEGEAPV